MLFLSLISSSLLTMTETVKPKADLRFIYSSSGNLYERVDNEKSRGNAFDSKTNFDHLKNVASKTRVSEEKLKEMSLKYEKKDLAEANRKLRQKKKEEREAKLAKLLEDPVKKTQHYLKMAKNALSRFKSRKESNNNINTEEMDEKTKRQRQLFTSTETYEKKSRENFDLYLESYLSLTEEQKAQVWEGAEYNVGITKYEDLMTNNEYQQYLRRIAEKHKDDEESDEEESLEPPSKVQRTEEPQQEESVPEEEEPYEEETKTHEEELPTEGTQQNVEEDN